MSVTTYSGLTNMAAAQSAPEVLFNQNLAALDEAIASLFDKAIKTTINATPTVCGTLATETDRLYMIEGKILAAEQGGVSYAAYHFEAVYDNDGGSVSEKSAPEALRTDFESSGWGAVAYNLQISGTSINLCVTGLAATTINWFTQLRAEKVTLA